MKVNLKFQNKTYNIDLDTSKSILDFKILIMKKTKVMVYNQELKLYNQLIDESKKWSFYKIYNRDLFILTELPGRASAEDIDPESESDIDEEIFTKDVLDDPKILETMNKKWTRRSFPWDKEIT